MKLNHTSDFHGGLQIQPDKIQEWHTAILKKLQAEPKLEYAASRSGNSLVIGVRADDGYIRIVEVTNGYKLYEYE